MGSSPCRESSWTDKGRKKKERKLVRFSLPLLNAGVRSTFVSIFWRSCIFLFAVALVKHGRRSSYPLAGPLCRSLSHAAYARFKRVSCSILVTETTRIFEASTFSTREESNSSLTVQWETGCDSAQARPSLNVARCPSTVRRTLLSFPVVILLYRGSACQAYIYIAGHFLRVFIKEIDPHRSYQEIDLCQANSREDWKGAK